MQTRIARRLFTSFDSFSRRALTRAEILGGEIPPRFNIAPTTQIPVVRLPEAGQRELIELRWSFIPRFSQPVISSPA